MLTGRDLRRLATISCIPLAFFLLTGIAGLSFGHYWDDEVMFDKVRRALAAPPTLLPGYYDYPSVSFWQAIVPLVPEALTDRALRQRHPDTSALTRFTRTETYRLRARGVYLATTSLALVWIAGLSLAIGGSSGEALLAAALAASSWEISYQTRWVAPDGTMMMCAALTVYALAAAMSAAGRAQRTWMALATVATGFACGSKYSAWPLVIPLAIAAWRSSADEGRWPRVTRVVKYLCGAVGMYVLTTPGTVLQPSLFLHDAAAQVLHYATGHGVHTVTPGFQHLRLMIVYLSAVLFSPWRVLSVMLAIGVVAGAWTLWRRSVSVAIVILSFPVFYVLYFSMQRVMIVRNLLVLVPFLVVLAARGVALAIARIPSASLRRAAVAIVVSAIAADGGYVARSASTIRTRSTEKMLREFSDWAAMQPAGAIGASKRVREALAASHFPALETLENEHVAYIAVSSMDEPLPRVEANRVGTFPAQFGPRDVNLDYYPTWAGDERVLVVPVERARADGIIPAEPLKSGG